MSDKKQTSVQWLAEQIITTKWKFADITDRNAIIEQALQMEREQIIESYCQGCADLIKDESIFPRETSEEYFQEIYGGQDESNH